MKRRIEQPYVVHSVLTFLTFCAETPRSRPRGKTGHQAHRLGINKLPERGPKRAVDFDVLDAVGHKPQPLIPAVDVDVVVMKLDGQV